MLILMYLSTSFFILSSFFLFFFTITTVLDKCDSERHLGFSIEVQRDCFFYFLFLFFIVWCRVTGFKGAFPRFSNHGKRISVIIHNYKWNYTFLYYVTLARCWCILVLPRYMNFPSWQILLILSSFLLCLFYNHNSFGPMRLSTPLILYRSTYACDWLFLLSLFFVVFWRIKALMPQFSPQWARQRIIEKLPTEHNP